jgi:hypothetical protein
VTSAAGVLPATGLPTTVILPGLLPLLRSMKSLALSGASGTIRPDRWSAWITITLGAAFLALGVLGLLPIAKFSVHSSLPS